MDDDFSARLGDVDNAISEVIAKQREQRRILDDEIRNNSEFVGGAVGGGFAVNMPAADRPLPSGGGSYESMGGLLPRTNMDGVRREIHQMVQYEIRKSEGQLLQRLRKDVEGRLQEVEGQVTERLGELGRLTEKMHDQLTIIGREVVRVEKELKARIDSAVEGCTSDCHASRRHADNLFSDAAREVRVLREVVHDSSAQVKRDLAMRFEQLESEQRRVAQAAQDAYRGSDVKLSELRNEVNLVCGQLQGRCSALVETAQRETVKVRHHVLELEAQLVSIHKSLGEGEGRTALFDIRRDVDELRLQQQYQKERCSLHGTCDGCAAVQNTVAHELFVVKQGVTYLSKLVGATEGEPGAGRAASGGVARRRGAPTTKIAAEVRDSSVFSSGEYGRVLHAVGIGRQHSGVSTDADVVKMEADEEQTDEEHVKTAAAPDTDDPAVYNTVSPVNYSDMSD